MRPPMAELTVIYWRDIPAQLIARAGRASAKRELAARFHEAIDHAAMRSGAKDSDSYLSAWRRGTPSPCGDDLEAAIAVALRQIEDDYDPARLRRLVQNGGLDHPPPATEPLVFFAPSGKRGRMAIGTTVLNAARSLGVDLDSVCGGRGICGRCQIEIQHGRDAKLGISSQADHCSAPNAVEARYRSARGMAVSRRLGCQTEITDDLIVVVPEDSQVHRQIVRKDTSDQAIIVDPVVRLHFIEVEEPSLDMPRSDVDRLRAALRAQWAIGDVTLPLPLLAHLPSLLRAGGWKVTVALRHGREIVAIYAGLKEQIAGIAVDIGSTTLAAHLCALGDGKVLASAGVMNPQIRFGEDLMSRVSYAMMTEGGAAEMTASVRGAIDALIGDLCAEAGLARGDVVDMVMVGNPVMHHLLLGIDPRELGSAPFALAIDEALDVSAANLGLNVAPCAYVHLLPCIAGHVGADASAMVLAESPQAREEITLLVDVGTNAEIVLGNRHRLLACSSPTGPAFEGAQLTSGQRAAPGAIERICIDAVSLEPRFKVIGIAPWSDEAGFADACGSTRITGLCGSGIIDVVAELALARVIRPDGVFDSDVATRSSRLVPDGRSFKYVIFAGEPEIAVTQGDIRAVQLAKAALHAGCKLLMARLGITHIDRIRLAGAFGAHIDPLHALALGLIPDCALEHVSAAGNAAGHGARIALLNARSRLDIQKIVQSIEKIETALDPDFQSAFVAAMAIPHADDDYALTGRHVHFAPKSSRGTKRRRRAMPLRSDQ